MTMVNGHSICHDTNARMFEAASSLQLSDLPMPLQTAAVAGPWASLLCPRPVLRPVLWVVIQLVVLLACASAAPVGCNNTGGQQDHFAHFITHAQALELEVRVSPGIALVQLLFSCWRRARGAGQPRRPAACGGWSSLYLRLLLLLCDDLDFFRPAIVVAQRRCWHLRLDQRRDAMTLHNVKRQLSLVSATDGNDGNDSRSRTTGMVNARSSKTGPGASPTHLQPAVVLKDDPLGGRLPEGLGLVRRPAAAPLPLQFGGGRSVAFPCAKNRGNWIIAHLLLP